MTHAAAFFEDVVSDHEITLVVGDTAISAAAMFNRRRSRSRSHRRGPADANAAAPPLQSSTGPEDPAPDMRPAEAAASGTQESQAAASGAQEVPTTAAMFDRRRSRSRSRSHCADDGQLLYANFFKRLPSETLCRATIRSSVGKRRQR